MQSSRNGLPRQRCIRICKVTITEYKGLRWNRGSISAFSAGANTATLYVIITRVKGGGCTPPPSPARTNFSIMMECTPEISNCHSVSILCGYYYHTHPHPDRIRAQNSKFASRRMCTGTVCYVLYRGWGVVRWISQSTHGVAIADFWRTFYHEGKIRPGWWGWGVHTHPFHCSYHHVQSCSVRSSWEGRYHRLNMEVDLQRLFELHVTWCAQLYSLAETPQLPPSPHIWTCITRALLVSKDRRHLIVTQWQIHSPYFSSTPICTLWLWDGNGCSCRLCIGVHVFTPSYGVPHH